MRNAPVESHHVAAAEREAGAVRCEAARVSHKCAASQEAIERGFRMVPGA